MFFWNWSKVSEMYFIASKIALNYYGHNLAKRFRLWFSNWEIPLRKNMRIIILNKLGSKIYQWNFGMGFLTRNWHGKRTAMGRKAVSLLKVLLQVLTLLWWFVKSCLQNTQRLSWKDLYFVLLFCKWSQSIGQKKLVFSAPKRVPWGLWTGLGLSANPFWVLLILP